MEPNFEQDIPLPAIIAVFAVLMIGSMLLRRHLRKRMLVRVGQLTSDSRRVLSVQERVAGNRAWSKGEIYSNGRTLMACVWLLAIVWNLTFGVSFFKSFSNPEMKTGGIVMLGIFAAGGLVAIGFAVFLTMRHFRYGESRCYIDGKAGVLGKSMKGTVRTKSDVPTTGDFTFTLQCIDSYHTGTGKNRTQQTRVHWRGEQVVPSRGKSSRAGIPFSFDLPTEVPETGCQLAQGSLNWQLSIHAPVEGVDYSAIFVVPVFLVA